MPARVPRALHDRAPTEATVDCVDFDAESALAVIEPGGRLSFANGPLRLVLGLQMLRRGVARVHPDDAARLDRIGAGERPRRLQIRFANVAGGWVRLELDCHVVGAGRSLRILAASPGLASTPGPVAEEHPAADALVGIYAVQRGRFTYVNNAFERITGYPAKTLIGKRALDLVLREDRRHLLQSAARVIRGDRWLQYEYRIRTKDGSVRRLVENLSPLFEHGVSTTLGACVDMSGWHAAAEALRQGGGRLADVNAGTPDMLALTGPAGRFLFVNDVHAHVLGYKPRELLGVRALGLVHPDDLETLYEAANGWNRHRQTPPFEVRVAHKDGYWIWIETRLEVIRDSAGQHNGTVIISRDSTLRRRVEHEIQTIAQELRAPTEALAAFAYRAARGEASALFLVSAYARHLARQFNTGEPGDADAFIRAVTHQTVRLQSLIVDLLVSSAPGCANHAERDAA